MLTPLEKVSIIQTTDKEYEFKLYPFEEQKDLIANDILEGQSIVFISDRYETEGQHRHFVFYAA